MPFDHAKSQAEFAALPDWVKALLRCADTATGYGGGGGKGAIGFTGAAPSFRKQADASAWFDALCDLMHKRAEYSAPDPAAYAALPAPERTATNIVEMLDDGEEGGGFDQPCRFGNRVGGHAVYCHNDMWPHSPRKCRRSADPKWGEPHDECPGFAPNPNVS